MALTFSRPGHIGSGAPSDYADATELFLKRFSGSVSAAYKRISVAGGKVMHFPIQGGGKSQQVPVQGRMGAEYHEIGTPLEGLGGPALNEVVINVNGELVSHHVEPRIDHLMTHWQYREIVSTEMGNALGRAYDQMILRLCVKAAEVTASDLNGTLGGLLSGEQQIRTGTVLSAAASTATPDTYVAAFAAAATAMQEKDVPMESAVAYCTPRAANFVAQSSRALSTEFAKGNGTYQKGSVGSLFDFQIIPTNNIAQGDVTNTNDPRVKGENGYFLNNTETFSNVDMTNVEIIFVGGHCVADVPLAGLQVDVTGTDFFVPNRATMMSASYILGAGVVNPQCAAVLKLT